MPVVGNNSTNLSLNDAALVVAAGVDLFRTMGFLVEVTTFGFADPETVGFGIIGLRITPFRVFAGAGYRHRYTPFRCNQQHGQEVTSM